MASIQSIVHSDIFKGIGALNGGPFGKKLILPFGRTLWPDQVAQDSLELAKEYETKGLISSLDNLSGKPVYIFSALEDTIVRPQMQ